MLDPNGDIPSEHTRAELLRRSFLLFALELALRAHTHIYTLQHTHTHSLSLFHPSASICSQAVATFWWISQAYSLAKVDTGADHFSMNPSSLPSAWKACTLFSATILSRQSCSEPIKEMLCILRYTFLNIYINCTHMSNSSVFPDAPRHHSIRIRSLIRNKYQQQIQTSLKNINSKSILALNPVQIFALFLSHKLQFWCTVQILPSCKTAVPH